MENWKEVLLDVFGKKAKKKWKSVAYDIMSVDKGIKQAYLFDHWASSSEEMEAVILKLHQRRLVDNKLGILSVGSDLLIYSLLSFQRPSRMGNPRIVDISSSLEHPVVIDEAEVQRHMYFTTYQTFHQFLQFTSQIGEDGSNASELNLNYEVTISEGVNPPCLFGLALGYPSVYWFNLEEGEDNCLSMQPLYLFSIKGSIRIDLEGHGSRLNDSAAIHDETSNSIGDLRLGQKTCKSVAPNSSEHQICSPVVSEDHRVNKQHVNQHLNFRTENNSPRLSPHAQPSTSSRHVILSFSIPETVVDTKVKTHVEDWFSQWQSRTAWPSLFSQVWMEEELVQPKAVCL